ncbi:MAG: hypothetical protein LC730_02845, partial [Acidobacteria bacterium]|nr:hypothetical protein [Acidobacteriota bacterium]MCA1608382.1 hypothetical protein [Acidobacteriota bacterium]
MNRQRQVAELIADVREQVMFLRELGVDSLDARLGEISLPPIENEVQQNKVVETETPFSAPATVEVAKSVVAQPRSVNARSRLAKLPSLARRESNQLMDHKPVVSNENVEARPQTKPAIDHGEALF